MEQILRGKPLAEIDKAAEDILSDAGFEEIYRQAFSMENQVVYFPVRHHSTACAYHLMSVIEEYKPEPGHQRLEPRHGQVRRGPLSGLRLQ